MHIFSVTKQKIFFFFFCCNDVSPAKEHLSFESFRSLNGEERRVVTLRKQIEKLTSELSVANAELEDAKRCKELVEQELKGFEVQLFMSEASAQTLEVSYCSQFYCRF